MTSTPQLQTTHTGTSHDDLQKMHAQFAREMAERQLESDQAERTLETTRKKEEGIKAEIDSTKKAHAESVERTVRD